MDINELLGYSANCSLVICDGLASIKGNWPYSLRLLGNGNKLQQGWPLGSTLLTLPSLAGWQRCRVSAKNNFLKGT